MYSRPPTRIIDNYFHKKINAIVVWVPSHVVPLRKGCHHQWRRYPLCAQPHPWYQVPVSLPACSLPGQTSMSRSPSPFQRTQMKKRGRRARSTPPSRRCVWSYEPRTPSSPCPPGASLCRMSAPLARRRRHLLRKRACNIRSALAGRVVAAFCRTSSASLH